jgi:hypothetical protein
MAYPSRYYANPLYAAQYGEKYKTGCPACKHSKQLKKNDFWYCSKYIPGFPKLGNGQCEFWENKRK